MLRKRDTLIWDRRRQGETPQPNPPPGDLFADLLDNAPVMALLLDPANQVIGANEAARRFFEMDPSRLPASLVEVTLESRLFEIVRTGLSNAEVQLVHRRRTVATRLADGRRQGEKLFYLTDVTELRRLTTVRQEFVANLVHELKTPITSLRLTAESLLGEPPAKERRRFAERIVKEADLISKIIDNLRQLGDIEMGAMSIDPSHFDLSDLIHESVDRLGASRKINTGVEHGLIISTDRPKLAQALGNLLDNAVKFSPQATAIDVQAQVTGAEVVISVRDRGPGISPEHWSRVFERFYKVDRARPREAGGFGLGLAITKHLVNVLGGRIWTETARDGGQVFFIALPHQVLTGA
ncbi:MAG TPA: HAMP domain-containing sensor histidine kinase [Candidatus Dormibacteraeota bacterium]|nr:HAMP domain-containing sensor histidine kinase [Candidatus Dormibacteraeota bacterium]